MNDHKKEETEEDKQVKPIDKEVKHKKKPIPTYKAVLKALGPGIITGASDDDPSGIATYSQAGAQFGFGMLWLAIFQYPLMTVIQEMCARIGLVTGRGLAALIKQKYSRKIVFPITSLLLIANTINIGTDIGAMEHQSDLCFLSYLLLLQLFHLLHLLFSQKFLCHTVNM